MSVLLDIFCKYVILTLSQLRPNANYFSSQKHALIHANNPKGWQLVFWSVRTFSRRGGDGVKGMEGGINYLARCKFYLLENMKNWCKIQVLIYPLH